MAGANDVNIISIPLGDPGGNNKQLYALRAPQQVHGGGISILEAYAVNGAATGPGTSFSLALHRYTSAGTPALGGTIAGTIGGAGGAWVSGAPKEFDVADGFVPAGEWLVIQYDEQTNGNPTLGYVNIHYVMGRGAQ
jgi:hypothetical protein